MYGYWGSGDIFENVRLEHFHKNAPNGRCNRDKCIMVLRGYAPRTRGLYKEQELLMIVRNMEEHVLKTLSHVL